MAEKPKQSIEDILAACRTGDGGDGQAAAEPPSTPAASQAKPSSGDAPPPAKKKPGAMSVEEMLAAARAGKSGGKQPAASASKAKAPDKPKPAAKKDSPAAKPGVAKDTQSILAAARKPVQPGPISKAEAAARTKPQAEKKPGKKAIPVPPMPEKPAYAKVMPADTPREDRRTFLGTVSGVFFGSFLAVGFSTLTLTNLLWGLGLARFMFPNILTEPPTKFKVGFPADFSPGSVTTKFKAQFGIWVINYVYEGQPQIFAIKTVCTHLGCTPNWLEAEQKFKCPCHGSGFYKDGINFEGPAPRPLERYAIRLAGDGQLEVDKSKLFQEEMGQWRDSESFVPV